jgi:hypothetical protein
MFDQGELQRRSAEQSNGGRPDRRSYLPEWMHAVAAIVGGCTLILLHAARFGFWIVDDAAITFAYARNISDGNGSVLQPGAAPTEGFSNPAWLALLAAGRLVGLFDRGTIFGIPDYVVFPKALALLCCAGMLFIVYRTVRGIVRWPGLVTFSTGTGLAVIPSFVMWTFSGLENSLYALVVVALACLLFRTDRLLTSKVALLAGALAAIAALTRPDGLVYAAAYPIVVLIQVRRPTLSRSVRAVALAVAAFGVLFGAYLTWRYLTFGRLLALPGVAKGQPTPEVDFMARASELITYVGAIAAIVFGVVTGLVMAFPSKLRSGMISLGVVLGLAVIAYCVLQPDWMGGFRFATPVWAMGVLVGVLCTGAMLRRTGIRGRLVIVAALVAALIPAASLFETASTNFRAAPTAPMCTVTERSARNFNAYADILGVKEGSLLTPDVGGPALGTRLLITDLAGLAESKMADFWRAGDFAAMRDYIFTEVRPTFIEAHPPWIDIPGVGTDPRLTQDYVRIWVEPSNPTVVNWVRKDVVPSPEKLKEAQDFAMAAVVKASAIVSAAPRRHCGDTISPGQWPSTS